MDKFHVLKPHFRAKAQKIFEVHDDDLEWDVDKIQNNEIAFSYNQIIWS